MIKLFLRNGPPLGKISPFVFAAFAASFSDPAQAANATWDGGSGVNGNWSNPVNWVGDVNVPGSGDTATFDAAIANTWGLAGSPILIDSASQNIKNITFSLNAGNYTIGTTAGNSLFLTSSGTIQMLDNLTTASSTQTINAPLVIMGANATYTFANLKNNIASSLNIGGAISGGTAGHTVITLDSAQSSAPNQISGNISNGSATNFSVIQSRGTWTYSGSNSYTGSTTINGGSANLSGTYSGGGALVVQSAAGSNNTPTVNLTGNANFSGDVSLTGLGNTASLNLGSATAGGGALTAATSITLNGASPSGARLGLIYTAGNLDRILDATTVSMSNGLLTFTGNATTNTTETIGDLVVGAGQSSVTMNSFAGRVTTLSAATLSRQGNGTLSVAGTNLGSAGVNSSRLLFATAPTAQLIGSGGAPAGASSGIKNLGILPWAVAGSGSVSDFATYDLTNGVRALAANEVQTSITAAASPGAGTTGDNVKISAASETGIAGKTINSLFLASPSAQTVTGAGAGNSLTISSGGLAHSGNFASTVSGFDAINFGNGEAVVTVVANSGTVVLNSSVSVGANGGLTKSGAGSLVLGAANSYSGTTIVQNGILQIGNGGTTGDLGTSSAVSVLGGGTVNYNRTNALTINNVGGGGRVNSNNATGTLTLNQTAGDLTLKSLGGVSGATLEFAGSGTTSVGNIANTTLSYMTVAGENYEFTGGTVNLLDSARGFTSNIEVAGGILNLVNNNFSMSGVAGGTQTLTFSAGQINALASFGVSGLNGNGGAGAAGSLNSTFLANQTGGTFLVSSAQGRFDLGSTSTGNVSTYNLSGGTIDHSLGGGSFRLGADTGGTSLTTFNFSGGKILESVSILGAQGAGAKQAFVWTGGTLATLLYDATNLTSAAGTAVSTGLTNILTNGGGILAPGDIGTVGRTLVTGKYAVTSANAALAIDIGGLGTTTAFQEAPGSGKHDRVNISGSAILGGKLNVALVDGFTPTNANTFTVLTTASLGLSGAFTNTAAGSTAAGGGVRVALANGLSSFKVTYNSADVTLGGYLADNEWAGASGASWSSANEWSAFTPSLAGHIAKFADAPAAGPVAVNLDANQTVAGLQFASTTRNYTLGTSNASGLTLDNNGAASSVSVTGVHSIDVPIALNNNVTVTTSGSTDALTVVGAISGPGRSLTKAGAGTLTLAGANSYGGSTTITAGTLVVSGSIAGAATVQTGGILGGNGDIGGPLTTVSNGTGSIANGHIAPGMSPGVLTVHNTASLANNTFLDFELNLADVPAGTGGNDLLSILGTDGSNGDLTIGTGFTLNITAGLNFGAGTYHLITYTGALTDSSSSFSGWTVNGLLEGQSATFALGSNSIDLVVVAVPEPGACALLVGGLGLLIASRRLRRER